MIKKLNSDLTVPDNTHLIMRLRISYLDPHAYHAKGVYHRHIAQMDQLISYDQHPIIENICDVLNADYVSKLKLNRNKLRRYYHNSMWYYLCTSTKLIVYEWRYQNLSKIIKLTTIPYNQFSEPYFYVSTDGFRQCVGRSLSEAKRLIQPTSNGFTVYKISLNHVGGPNYSYLVNYELDNKFVFDEMSNWPKDSTFWYDRFMERNLYHCMQFDISGKCVDEYTCNIYECLYNVGRYGFDNSEQFEEMMKIDRPFQWTYSEEM